MIVKIIPYRGEMPGKIKEYVSSTLIHRSGTKSNLFGNVNYI